MLLQTLAHGLGLARDPLGAYGTSIHFYQKGYPPNRLWAKKMMSGLHNRGRKQNFTVNGWKRQACSVLYLMLAPQLHWDGANDHDTTGAIRQTVFPN